VLRNTRIVAWLSRAALAGITQCGCGCPVLQQPGLCRQSCVPAAHDGVNTGLSANLATRPPLPPRSQHVWVLGSEHRPRYQWLTHRHIGRGFSLHLPPCCSDTCYATTLHQHAHRGRAYIAISNRTFLFAADCPHHAVLLRDLLEHHLAFDLGTAMPYPAARVACSSYHGHIPRTITLAVPVGLAQLPLRTLPLTSTPRHLSPGYLSDAVRAHCAAGSMPD